MPMSTDTNVAPEATNDALRVVIVGGVAGGASAAARARRLSETAKIVMFERGEHVSFANCGLPYHIGGEIRDRGRLLVQTPESLYQRFRIDVRVRQEVARIDRQAKCVEVRDLVSGRLHTEPYDKLILSPGAAPLRPPIPGIDSKRVLTLRNIADMDAIKAIVDHSKPERAVVIGGGYIGLEMTEALKHRGLQVTVVEKLAQVMAPVDSEMAEPLHQQLRLHGVELRLGAAVTAVRDEQGEAVLTLDSGDELAAELVILAVGVKPETELASQAGLELGPRGGIKVDEAMRTSDPDVYAVGDAVETPHLVLPDSLVVPLAGPANRQGRMAADHLFGRPVDYRKTQGTAICKLFDVAIASTGANEKNLRHYGIPYEKVYVHPNNHAEYYPGASRLSLKLLFSPDDGAILGAQAVGLDGVDKRIDVLAVAQRAGMTVYDLEHLELCYAPPFGSARDVVNYAGLVAANVLRGEFRQCHVADVDALRPDQLLVDVRTTEEARVGTIPGSTIIPLETLRDRLDELPRDRELVVYCQQGLRGYVACRMLDQHGFTTCNLSGGYKTWSAFHPKHTHGLPTVPAQPAAVPTVELGDDATIVRNVDACGLQCPGPIMRLRDEIETLAPGDALTITVSDPGFVEDVPAWCASTGHQLVSVEPANGSYRAVIRKHAATPAPAPGAAGVDSKHKTIVVFSGDFDKVMAAFIIANGAAAMGSKVTLFFTFWGLNALRRAESVPVRKNLIERMFGWMMPRGAGKLGLSRMNMGGGGLAMIKGIMKKKNVASLEELIGSARLAGVRLVACTMSMDLMGIKQEELIPGVEAGGVAMYLNAAEQGSVNLFV